MKQRYASLLLVVGLLLLGLLTCPACSNPESTPTPTPTPSCDAAFDADSVNVQYPNLTVRFYDQSTGDITKWEWNFDSNYNDTIDRSYFDQQPYVEYTYPKTNRSYKVTLTITCQGGVQYEAFVWIEVSECPT